MVGSCRFFRRCGAERAVAACCARRKASRASAIDVAFYKDQLAAIDRDAADGLVPAADAEGAKAEAARRLLAAAEAPPQPSASEGRATRYAAIAAALFAPAAAVALYGYVGHPDLPDLPLVRAPQRTAGPHGPHGGDRENRGASGAGPE